MGSIHSPLHGGSAPARRSSRTWRRPRALVAVFAGTLVLGATASAIAVPVAPTDSVGNLKVRSGRLTDVGPLAEHGFPAWYRDSNGVRLEACTTLDDPLCPTLPDEVPNPDAPISWPDNFPGEFFYQLAGAAVTGTGVNMTVGMDLEGAFVNGPAVDGEQMVFGRIRIRDKAIADGEYRVIHPYGVDEFTAEGGTGINYTQDIGATAGAFGQALASRIGPFLKWDPAVAPAAPAGYIGNPGIDHKVVGSPYSTNYVAVERKVDGVWTEIARQTEFSIQGRLATNSGVDVQAATYSVGADGNGFADVYATSDAGQSIHVKDTGLGFIETKMEGDKGVYYGRYAINGSPDGKSVTVANVGDNPVAQKSVKLTDVVTVTKAAYDADADLLTVWASSSDQDSTPGKLTILGEPLTKAASADAPAGTLEATIHTVAPTATVTVTSDKGGSATVPVTASGPGMQADKPVAAAFANPMDAAPGQRVTLTGTGSTGTISSYEWTQVPGTKLGDVPDPNNPGGTMPGDVEVPIDGTNRVDLTGAATSVATFNAPTGYEGPLAFQLVVTGPAGTSDPVVVQVNVKAPDPTQPAPAPTADAGVDQTVRRGTVVTLDGSRSALADSYAWTQFIDPLVGSPTVNLTGAGTAKPTFTYPLMALPASTTGDNPTYKVDSAPLQFDLKVTGQGGQVATDSVKVSPQSEAFAITAAEFRTGNGWRVSGTSDILAGQRVAVVLGNALTGRVLGRTNVDAAGAWSFRGAANVQPPTGTTTVSAVSEMGGSQTGFTFRRR